MKQFDKQRKVIIKYDYWAYWLRDQKLIEVNSRQKLRDISLFESPNAHNLLEYKLFSILCVNLIELVDYSLLFIVFKIFFFLHTLCIGVFVVSLVVVTTAFISV